MAICSLFLAALLGAPDGKSGDDPSVDLRALRGYLGLYSSGLKASSGTLAQEVGLDLRARLGSFLDRTDLPPEARAGAIAIYHDLAREIGSFSLGGQASAAPLLREVYSELIRRMEQAGEDTLEVELERLASPGIGLEPQEIYEALVRLMPALRERAAPLPPEERSTLSGLLRRILSVPGWPDLESGAALTGTIDLLLAVGGSQRAEDAPVIAAKLAEWTHRLLAAEAAREGELAQETAIIHLYRALETAGRDLDEKDRSAVLARLAALLSPEVAGGPSSQEGAIGEVEIGEVRLPLGAGQRIPPLPPQLSPDGSTRYLLVPRKSYQVELIAAPAGGGGRSSYWVLARAGADSRLLVPRSIPPGMVPITAETGRIAFLADRKPWSIRRFLLAFQRCGNALASDPDAVHRIYKHTALREIQLGGSAPPSFSALVELLSDPLVKDHLESTFWVDSRDATTRATAFEIAGGILNGNTGLRDTALTLPTVAEANRLLHEGERFALAEPQSGLFNAIRLVPEPAEDSQRSRYAIRTVLRLPSP